MFRLHCWPFLPLYYACRADSLRPGYLCPSRSCCVHFLPGWCRLRQYDFLYDHTLRAGHVQHGQPVLLHQLPGRLLVLFIVFQYHDAVRGRLLLQQRCVPVHPVSRWFLLRLSHQFPGCLRRGKLQCCRLLQLHSCLSRILRAKSELHHSGALRSWILQYWRGCFLLRLQSRVHVSAVLLITSTCGLGLPHRRLLRCFYHIHALSGRYLRHRYGRCEPGPGLRGVRPRIFVQLRRHRSVHPHRLPFRRLLPARLERYHALCSGIPEQRHGPVLHRHVQPLCSRNVLPLHRYRHRYGVPRSLLLSRWYVRIQRPCLSCGHLQ